METEADDVGMQLLAKESAMLLLLLLLLLLAAHRHQQACIDPQAMVRVFQTFQQNSKKSESLLQPCVVVAPHLLIRTPPSFCVALQPPADARVTFHLAQLPVHAPQPRG